jgi:uncharacterized protein (TIGR00661 family)
MKKPSILWGICGIGNGHTYRQLPLLERYLPIARIVVFAYGESYGFYRRLTAGRPDVAVLRVSVPFYAGGRDGLDFEATARRAENRRDGELTNHRAMAEAQRRIGTPDLVVSDYEPVSARYAYAHGAPLVTIDQQSKYLVGDFPDRLGGQGYGDEVMRLRLFFPRADRRLAFSFFKVPRKPGARETVTVLPPVLNDAVLRIRRGAGSDRTSLLVYLSSQQPFRQSLREVLSICRSFPGADFHLFGRGMPDRSAGNVTLYEHGDPRFHRVLAACGGIVGTAGHTLLSEAMHLGIPVYAVPLPLYEQRMNARVIHENGFGISHPRLDRRRLAAFLRDLPRHEAAIRADRKVLLRGSGRSAVFRCLDRVLCGSRGHV